MRSRLHNVGKALNRVPDTHKHSGFFSTPGSPLPGIDLNNNVWPIFFWVFWVFWMFLHWKQT